MLVIQSTAGMRNQRWVMGVERNGYRVKPGMTVCEMGSVGIRTLCKPNAILFDVKSVLPVEAVDG